MGLSTPWDKFGTNRIWVPSRRVPAGAKIVLSNNVLRVLVAVLQNKRGMSAFPGSGHSDHQILGEIRVRFRPEADMHCVPLAPGTLGLGAPPSASYLSLLDLDSADVLGVRIRIVGKR